MVAGHPPFSKAVKNDRHYAPFLTGKQKQFWAAMNKGRKRGYSNDFMDLV